jgi:hypothetical protein
MGGMFFGGDTESNDKKWWIMISNDEATPTLSYYLFCSGLPSKISFGVNNSKPQFFVDVK